MVTPHTQSTYKYRPYLRLFFLYPLNLTIDNTAKSTTLPISPTSTIPSTNHLNNNRQHQFHPSIHSSKIFLLNPLNYPFCPMQNADCHSVANQTTSSNSLQCRPQIDYRTCSPVSLSTVVSPHLTRPASISPSRQSRPLPHLVLRKSELLRRSMMSSETLLLKLLRSITETFSKQLKVSNSKWYVLLFPHVIFWYFLVFFCFAGQSLIFVLHRFDQRGLI